MKRLLTILTCLVVLTSLSVTLFAAGGEICATATAITSLPYTDAGSTATAVDDYNEICPYTPIGAPDVVYSYTAGAAGFLDISTCTGTSNYDTKLYVYAGSCPTPGTGATGTEVACNDDACTAPLYGSPFVASLTNVAVAAGTTYYIVVDGYDAASLGNYTISVDNAANPPGGSDLDIIAGFLGDLTQVPCSQNVPDSFFAAVFNAGAMTENGISVTMDAIDAGASIFTDVSSTTQNILAAQTAGFNGSTVYAPPCDTPNTIVYQFVHSLTGDDSTANDTIFDFKFYNDSTMAFDLAIFAGVDIFIANISGATATAELACWYIMAVTDTLTSVTAFLQPDVTEIGQVVTVSIYNFLDTLPLVTSNPQTMDTGQFAWDFEFPGGFEMIADSGYLVAVKNGTVALGLTDVLTTGFSSWGRQQSPDDNWGFFSGLDWMIWANFGPVKEVCNPPANLTSTVTGPQTVILSWDPVPGALAYELTGGVAGNPASYVDPIIRVGENNTTFNVAALCIDFTYEWTVRTICDITGTDTTRSEYAALDLFTTDVCGTPGPATTSVSGSQAVLMWVSVNGAIGYRISGQAQGGGIVVIDVPGGATSSFTVNNLPAANYLWQVQAICAQSTLCVPGLNTGGAAASSFTISGAPAKTWNQDMFNPVIYDAVSIYPNPASDQTTIRLKDASTTAVEVYDVEGRLMSISTSMENGDIVLNTSSLENGVYQIMMKGETTTITEKLVIAR